MWLGSGVVWSPERTRRSHSWLPLGESACGRSFQRDRFARLAGYSETPLARKLGLAAGYRALLLGAPRAFRAELRPLPDGVRFARSLDGLFDVIVLFAKRAGELERGLAKARVHMKPACGLWVAWPKKSSGVATELDFERVQKAGLSLGLVDNKVCAVDEVWSGLRFVIRRKDR